MTTGYKINGKDFGEYGILVNRCSPAQSSSPQYDIVEIPGRAEKLRIDTGVRTNVQLILECTIVESNKIRSIYSDFQGEVKFIHRDENDKYYKAYPEVITPERIALHMNTITITLVCSPFAYAVENTTYTMTLGEFWLVNRGTYYCQPVYRLNGNGTLTLEVNDDTENKLVIENVDGYVIVDAEKLIVHKDGTFKKSKGQIPFFAVGNNKIKTNATSIEITKNERWI